MSHKNIQDLLDLLRNKSTLCSISSLLGWDQDTYMPPKGVSSRSLQQELIAELQHREATSPQLKTMLSKYIHIETGHLLADHFTEKEKAILREIRKDYLAENSLPVTFVKKWKKITTESLSTWKTAKQQDAFSLFSPCLETIVQLSREKTKYLGYEEHPYDALLNLFEPGLTVRHLDPLFDLLKTRLIALLERIKQTPQPRYTFLEQHFPHDQQVLFSKMLMKDMGIDEQSCRIDFAEHPFCLSLGQSDVRITTHVHEYSIMDTLFATIHETGHALYELGLPKEEFGNPLGEAASFGIHESQSRLWEVYIGQSYAFWEYYTPLLIKAFPKQLEGIKTIDLYHAVNYAEPSLIRIFADEVTYSLHIILRYELEKGLLEGSIAVQDLPQLWKEKMLHSFGIVPNTDREGVLQDVHWSSGLFGYFPSYALGNMYAAQLWHKLRKEVKDNTRRITRGNLLFIRDWMAQNIYEKGRLYPPLTLIERATGEKFSPEPYLNYLENKYPLS